MKIARQIVVLDAADLTAESTFWAELLGGTVDAEDDWHNIYVDGEPRLVEDNSCIWITAGAAVGELTPRRRTANSTC